MENQLLAWNLTANILLQEGVFLKIMYANLEIEISGLSITYDENLKW